MHSKRVPTHRGVVGKTSNSGYSNGNGLPMISRFSKTSFFSPNSAIKSHAEYELTIDKIIMIKDFINIFIK